MSDSEVSMQVLHVTHCLPPSHGPLGRTELTLTGPDGSEHVLIYNGLLTVKKDEKVEVRFDEEGNPFLNTSLRYAR